MKTEKQKMVSGELYDALDPELSKDRMHARMLLKSFNDSGVEAEEERKSIVRELLPNAGGDLWLQAPFYCDYGYNIITGEKVFLNFNCIILDVMQVYIGNRTMAGPNVQIYTATHPMDFKERASGREYAKPVHIGEDVWIGGGVIICPGVNIGDRTVIGAGSVVTRDIPSDVFAAGNPCKIIRNLEH
jgi:maltose O-acetyltransferase